MKKTKRSTTALAMAGALSLLCSIAVSETFLESSEASFTSSANAKVTVSAEEWVIKSLKTSAFFASNITVNWDKVGSYDNYFVQWSTSANFANPSSSTVTGTSFEATNLNEETTYYFRIRAVGAPNDNGWSTTSSVKTPKAFTSRLVGNSGWSTSIVAPVGDLNGDGKRDFVRHDPRYTVFYYYLGDGAGSHTGQDGIGRFRIDANFPDYKQFFGVQDWNRDGRDDIMTVDAAGDLWLYTATPNINLVMDDTNAFNPRVKMGIGWGTFKNLVGVNDVTGDGYSDLIAVDTSGTGTLRIYPSIAGGNHGSPIIVGSDWNQYAQIVPIGDLNGDGKNDILALSKNGSVWYYAGTGAPNNSAFKARVQVPGMQIDPNNRFTGVGDMTSDSIPDIFEIYPVSGLMYSWSGSDIKTALGFK